MNLVRKILLWPVCALMWYAGLNIFFGYSGAQSILANPKYQSQKMLDIFFKMQPPARDAESTWPLVEGFFVTGLFMAIALNIINSKLRGHWLKKGFVLGCTAWMLVIPWFEFYLPYNLMREPFLLVLFECLLWFGVMQLIGFSASFVLNFRSNAGKAA
jgi:hypothetical protein